MCKCVCDCSNLLTIVDIGLTCRQCRLGSHAPAYGLALVAADAEGLDVERLARALAMCGVWRADKTETLRDLATTIAREYAALTPKGPTDD